MTPSWMPPVELPIEKWVSLYFFGIPWDFGATGHFLLSYLCFQNLTNFLSQFILVIILQGL